MDISVIIPALNEAARIATTIERTRELGDCQIIVVDGGSDDGTLAAASQSAADICLSAPRGRARQQNAGAARAQGDVLLFLHADCWLEQGGSDAIRKTLKDDRCVGGCFRQTIDAQGLGYRLIERGNAIRAQMLKWAYGDQGIFVRRATFESIGGFPDVDLMEDLYFMKRLKRRGRFKVVDHRLHVCPRRWRQQGLIRQTLTNWSFLLLAHAGVSPRYLADRYAHIR